MTELRELAKEAAVYSTKTDIAYEAMRISIIAGTLAPGSPLNARNVAGELDMSVIPVREALRRLEQDGLVTIKPHLGATVRSLPLEDLQENLLIRSELEALATRLTAQNANGELLDKLTTLVAKMDECASEGNANKFGSLNREFHMQIYAANGYSKLFHLIETLWDQVPRARSVFALVPGYMEHSQRGHHRLLEALKKNDAAEAEGIMRQQKERALSSILSVEQPTLESEHKD